MIEAIYCGTDNFINGTALYRVAINNDQLSELTFKGYTGNPDSLVIPFEKNAIVLMVGRYVYEDKEYLSLIQATPVLSPDPNYIPTSNDLPSSLPLLIYSAMPVSGSYLLDSNSGRESFMLARRLYNDNVSPINLMDILSQIQNKTASTTSTPPNVNSASPSSNAHHTPQTATNNNESFSPEMEDNTAPDLDTEFIMPIYEDPTPEPPAKRKKHTLPSRKK
ncbi:hypothetical protein F8M41_012799 [Gigaspora margarita]|uniref:Uncharacterized protein n=1 Tax=Gigaspora margarita TaxID=4874 RepID=A0A8H4EUU4_GIGMA|nr:hypothetical protein F8M41_012799 [Gigaspora margarita]